MSAAKSSPLPINIPVILQLSRSEDISVADLPIVPQGLTLLTLHIAYYLENNPHQWKINHDLNQASFNLA